MLRCRILPLLALRMLSSSPSYSANPNSRLPLLPSSPIPQPSLSHHHYHHPLFSNSIRGLPRTQTMTISRSLLSGPTTGPIPVSTGPDESESQSLVVVSFYKFADFPDHADMRKPLKDFCQQLVPILFSLSNPQYDIPSTRC